MGVGEGRCHLAGVGGRGRVDGGLARGKAAGRDKWADSLNSADVGVMECSEGLTWDGEREGSQVSD